MRNEDDYRRIEEDQTHGMDLKKELTKLNKHVKGNYAVFNQSGRANIDTDFWDEMCRNEENLITKCI